jgi:DNA repair protein RecN (Recombination protein N)
MECAMLEELRICNLALIDDARLTFGPGLTVLTGETGAGKTALLSALKLLIGERGDAKSVKRDEARVEALFAPDEHIVVRRLNADGRSRCALDDEMVTVGALAKVIGPLVDLYGQHDHTSLLKPAAQLEAIDAFACTLLGDEGDAPVGASSARPLSTAKDTYTAAFHAYKAANLALIDLRHDAGNSQTALDAARFALEQINVVAPEPDELDNIKARLPILRGGEELAAGTNAAFDALRGADGALEWLARAQTELAQIRGIDPVLEGLAQRIDNVQIDLDDAAQELRAYRDTVQFDPEALELALSRAGQLEGLARRFGGSMTAVFERRADAEKILDASANYDERLQQLEAELAQSTSQLKDAAAALHSGRAAAAERFGTQLTTAVQDLAMQGAQLSVEFSELPFEQWQSTGSYNYTILYKPSAGTTPRPLAKIASGGELSRVMLAIKTLLAQANSSQTLIFDEIDAGIGGATATAVGARLARLAEHNQVIVVTHLAQVAAFAQTHWVVKKSESMAGDVETSVFQVVDAEREAEIARMLSGETSEIALAHARELLASATDMSATVGASIARPPEKQVIA